MIRDYPVSLGVIKGDTTRAASGYLVDSDKIRYYNGRIETIGGYTDIAPGQKAQGTARKLYQWSDLVGRLWTAIGTSSKLYVYSDMYIYDVTPIVGSGATVNAVSTAAGSPIVSITLAAHGFVDGQVVYFSQTSPVGGVQLGANGSLSNPFYTGQNSSVIAFDLPGHGLSGGELLTIVGSASVNGINPNGTWTVTVTDPDTLTFDTGTPATDSGFGGGPSVVYAVASPYAVTVSGDNDFTITYPTNATASAGPGGGALAWYAELPPGNIDATAASGWGRDGFGTLGFSMDPDAGDRLAMSPRTWSMANYGMKLLANPLGGTIYEWNPGVSTRSTKVLNAPTQCCAILVTAETILMAFGTMSYGSTVFDPMQIAWTTSANDPNALMTGGYTTWQPATDNLAGDERIQQGSYIVEARRTTNGFLVFTDTTVLFGRFVGSSLQTYSFTDTGQKCGLSAPNAVEVESGVAWWLSPNGIQYFQGSSPVVMPCPIQAWFLEQINQAQIWKCVLARDAKYNAFYVFYPSVSGSGEIDSYIRCDINVAMSDPRGGWSVGTTDMTTWIDRESAASFPISVRNDGMICIQDTDTMTADGSPMPFLIASAATLIQSDVGNGGRQQSISRVYVDCETSGPVTFTAQTKRRLSTNLRDVSFEDGGVITPSKMTLSARGSGQEFQFQITGQAGSFRLGLLQGDITATSQR